jgi:hypothetical protein
MPDDLILCPECDDTGRVPAEVPVGPDDTELCGIIHDPPDYGTGDGCSYL